MGLSTRSVQTRSLLSNHWHSPLRYCCPGVRFSWVDFQQRRLALKSARCRLRYHSPMTEALRRQHRSRGVPQQFGSEHSFSHTARFRSPPWFRWRTALQCRWRLFRSLLSQPNPTTCPPLLIDLFFRCLYWSAWSHRRDHFCPNPNCHPGHHLCRHRDHHRDHPRLSPCRSWQRHMTVQNVGDHRHQKLAHKASPQSTKLTPLY